MTTTWGGLNTHVNRILKQTHKKGVARKLEKKEIRRKLIKEYNISVESKPRVIKPIVCAVHGRIPNNNCPVCCRVE